MVVTESDSLQKKWHLLHSYSKPSTLIHIQEHYREIRHTKYKLLPFDTRTAVKLWTMQFLPWGKGPQVDKQGLHPLQEAYIQIWNTHQIFKADLSSSCKLKRNRPIWPSCLGKHSSLMCQVRQNKPPTHTEGIGFIFNETQLKSTRFFFFQCKETQSSTFHCHLHLLHYQESPLATNHLLFIWAEWSPH